jgi:RimJ/RimL family protein N-acetyltransferase
VTGTPDQGPPDQGPPDAGITTARLDLVPLGRDNAAALADEMVEVLSGPGLYEFTGGGPPTRAGLQDRYARLAAGHSPDGSQEWWNWIVRQRRSGAGAGTAVGTVQATITGGGALAEIAWVVGTAWQGRGFASEAALALAGWLEARGVRVITACVHPRHDASAAVAERAGLRPTDEFQDRERVWRRERPG